MTNKKEIDELIKIIKKLRNPKQGCPWDIKQTSRSLIPYVLEEAYEVSEALKTKNKKHIIDELGDLLLQIVMQSQIASEKKHFNFADILTNLNEKLKRRHPHVFKKSINNKKYIKELNKQWDKIKRKENKSNQPHQIFKKLTKYSPFIQAIEIGAITSQLDFDWSNYNKVINKVNEELNELKQEINKKTNNNKILEEYGDLLFTISQLGRHLSIDPETALYKANIKFKKRFIHLLTKFKNKKDFKKSSDKIKEKKWKIIKKLD
mgnify:CR=1 FL=1